MQYASMWSRVRAIINKIPAAWTIGLITKKLDLLVPLIYRHGNMEVMTVRCVLTIPLDSPVVPLVYASQAIESRSTSFKFSGHSVT